MDKLFSTFEIQDFEMLTFFWLSNLVFTLHQRTCIPLAMMNEFRFTSTCLYAVEMLLVNVYMLRCEHRWNH